MKAFIASVLFALAFAAGAWLIVIPDDFVAGQLQKALAGRGLSAEISGLEKGFFFDFHIRSIRIRKAGRPLLAVDELSARINPLSLALLELPASFRGTLGGGTVSGTIELLKKRILVTFDNARIEELGFFSLAGISGDGILSGEIKGSGEDSTFKVAIRNMKLDSGEFLGLQIPFGVFDSAKGALTFRRDTLKIDSLFLEGKDISARVKGTVAGGKADLSLEVMKGSSFTDTSGILPFIEGYRVSPGYYVIPLKGDLPL